MDSDFELANFDSAYRVWLADLVYAGSEFIILFDVLYDTPFSVIVDDDSNRAMEGVELRRRFSEESRLHIPERFMDKPCSFLEMLIGLAISLEDRVLYDGYAGDRAHVWFWMMMENLGLDVCNDNWMIWEPGSFWRVCRILETVCDRTYDASGAGGIFPLRIAAKDQRNEGLWSQAHAFLLENRIS